MIAITRPDGGVSIAADAETLEKFRIDFPEMYQSHEEVTEIPTDRTFRKAWKAGNGKIDHDISKCKEIAHAKRRADRAKEFAPLDIEATIPAKAAQAEAKRQAIRDRDAAKQAAIDAATTVEQLKALL